MKLLSVSEAFERFPHGRVDVETFVNIMKEILGDTSLVKREAFVQEMVDLFFRAKSDDRNLMKFEDLTTYLIEHEIEAGDLAKEDEHLYKESTIKDQTTHNNYIG